jgi:hypothetical protein
MADGGKVKSEERKLLGLFGQLAPDQQNKLMSFAELLAGDAAGAKSSRRGERVAIARPPRETVALAIRRLVRSYPTLERRKLMGEASRLMAQHALEGRPAPKVIDELEALFERHYKSMRNDE